VPCRRRFGVGPYDKQATWCEPVQALSDDMPQPATNPIANHRGADLAADGETDARGFVDVIPELQV
jgi:hypothetical protein